MPTHFVRSLRRWNGKMARSSLYPIQENGEYDEDYAADQCADHVG